MKRAMLTVLALGLAYMNIGCASVLAYRHTQDRALRARVASGEVGVGVDVTALSGPIDWPLQIGAAVVDAGIGFAAYKLYEEIQDDEDDDDKPTESRSTSVTAGESVYIYQVETQTGNATGDASGTGNYR